MKMFRLYKIGFVKEIAVSLLMVICMVSCADDDLYNGNVADGTPVTVKFDFSVPEQDIIVSTRAIGEDAAKRVENLYVLGFKNNEKVFGFYYESELGNGDITTLASKEEVPAGTYDIYAVANINSDVYGVDEITDNTDNSKNLRSFLDQVSTKDQFLNKTVSILNSSRNLDRTGASLLMAGALCDESGNAVSCLINSNGQLVKTINLKRLDSEITFNFNSGANVAFSAKRWYVVNAPAKSFLVEQSSDGADRDNRDYFHTYKQKEEDRNPIYDNTFTYYMPENRKTVKKSGIQTYADREKEVTNGDNMHDIDPATQRRNYVYAPDNGTYVVVTGHYEGPANAQTAMGGSEKVVAEVQYIIHLGFVNKNAEDFFSKRNTKYTYNVTVSGVDNIIVEVEDGKENQPGATGDVIFGGSDNVYTLDSHYETVLLTFDFDELVTAYGDGKISELFTSVANTPYTSMLNSEQAKIDDQNWVKVVKNDNASEEFKSYYENRNDLISVQKMLDDLKEAVKNNDRTMFAWKNGRRVVTYTCFVDEFYYDKSDLPSGVESRLPDNTNIWKSFVNSPNRTMYIICYRRESPDKESSIINSKYVISQRSIQTFYSTNPTPGEKVVAYGIETLNETGNLPVYNPMYYDVYDKDYGWFNFNTHKKAINWTHVIDKSNGYNSLEKNKNVNKYGNFNPEGSVVDASNYLKAMEVGYIKNMNLLTACMQRNRRELSSSDYIEEGDVKWYLPAINQYQSFYLGEPAISQESRLFSYPFYNPVAGDSYQFINHYGSSTYSGSGNARNVYLFWAEEAVSVSTWMQLDEWTGVGGGSSNVPETPLLKNADFKYRCMRNLGSDGANDRGKFTPYQSASMNANGRHELKIDKLNPLIKSRGRVTGELGHHFYQDNGNYFYANGFEVANDCDGLLTTLERATGVKTEGGTGCEPLNANLPAGEAKWRVPNLRELTLMWQHDLTNSVVGTTQGVATSRTQMSYKYTGNVWFRKGWVVTKTVSGGTVNIGMSMPDAFTTVRCVRDLK